MVPHQILTYKRKNKKNTQNFTLKRGFGTPPEKHWMPKNGQPTKEDALLNHRISTILNLSGHSILLFSTPLLLPYASVHFPTLHYTSLLFPISLLGCFSLSTTRNFCTKLHLIQTRISHLWKPGWVGSSPLKRSKKASVTRDVSPKTNAAICLVYFWLKLRRTPCKLWVVSVFFTFF